MTAPANPAHGLWLDIDGVPTRFADTFKMSLALEERFGPLPKFVERMARDGASFTVAEIADFLSLAAVHASGGQTPDIGAHISRAGRNGAMRDISRIVELLVVGWEGLRDAAGKNPPAPMATGGYPGTTSSAPPASSDGAPPTSGAPGPSNSPRPSARS